MKNLIFVKAIPTILICLLIDAFAGTSLIFDFNSSTYASKKTNHKQLEPASIDGPLVFDATVKNTTRITFEDFTLEFENLVVWDNGGQLKQVQKDEAKVYLDLGETIQGKRFKIVDPINLTFKIYQRHENSITVMNEGPHCDLIDWKHYYSNWKALQPHGEYFETHTYNAKDSSRFIPIKNKALREAVETHCGSHWAKLVEKVKKPDQYPCGVGISSVFLRITYLKEGKAMEKIVSFEIPMGC